MSNNFTFLKNTDKNLYDIISDAEKLYRDEYFEQCIAQTRRFAETICKKVLGDNYVGSSTFDEMLATLKDKSHGFEQEKEFIDDLYFLKQQGNLTVHASRVNQDAIVALECLKRSFEVAISYSVYYKNQKNDILKHQYDVELLITGKKNKSLAQRYSEKKRIMVKDKPVEKKSSIKNTTTKKKIKTIVTKDKPINKKSVSANEKKVQIKKNIKNTQPKRTTRKKKNNSNFFIGFIKFFFVLSLLVIFFLICFSRIYDLSSTIK